MVRFLWFWSQTTVLFQCLTKVRVSQQRPPSHRNQVLADGSVNNGAKACGRVGLITVCRVVLVHALIELANIGP